MTGWIIGFATEAASPSEGTWRDTRLGGYPIWPDEDNEEKRKRPQIEPCPLCNRPRLLLLQAYAPHPAHQHRFLVVFACNSALCARDVRSWCAYRCFQANNNKESHQDNTKKEIPAKEQINNDDDAVNWDTSSSSSSSCSDNKAPSETSLGELEAMLNDTLNIAPFSNSNKNNKRQDNSNDNNDINVTKNDNVNKNSTNIKLDKSAVPATAIEKAKEDVEKQVGAEGGHNFDYFRPHFIEVQCDEQVCSSSADDGYIERLLKAYEASEAEDTTSWGGEDDAEETEAVVAEDEFRRAIERHPQQVLRYKFDGDPLWPKHPAPTLNTNNINCRICAGRARNVFELQILGTVLYFLDAQNAAPRNSNSKQEAPLNFMAVAIYTCVNDCELNINNNSNSSEDEAFGPASGDGDEEIGERVHYQYHRVEVVIQPDVW